jgi:adenylate kinase
MERNWGHERIEIGRRIISFIGPEGSGKTENAKRLSVASGKLYIATGDTLRDLAKNDPGYYGEEARKMFANSAYFDPKLLLEVMSNRFSKEDTRDGWILDGGLRKFEETRDFEATLIRVGRNFPVTVIYLNIPTAVTFVRLMTGKNARRRSDDTQEGLEGRLAEFNFRLDERLNIIRNNPNWNMIEIDAIPPLETVFKNVCDAIVQPR